MTISAGDSVREAVVDTPAVIVTAAERAAGPVLVTVRQRGTLTESAGTTMEVI